MIHDENSNQFLFLLIRLKRLKWSLKRFEWDNFGMLWDNYVV